MLSLLRQILRKRSTKIDRFIQEELNRSSCFLDKYLQLFGKWCIIFVNYIRSEGEQDESIVRWRCCGRDRLRFSRK